MAFTFPFSLFFAPDDPPSGGQLDDEEEQDAPEDEGLEDESDPEEDEEEDEEWDYERGMSTIRKLRGEVKEKTKREKKLEAELAEYREEQKRREDEEKSELQKAQEKADALEREKQELEQTLVAKAIKSSIEREARAAGFENPEDAYSFLGGQELELDDDDEVVGVKKMVKKLVEEKPYLLESKDQGRNRTPPRDSRKRPPSESGALDGKNDVALNVPVEF